MPGEATELLRGTLNLLILKALALQEMHGMEISRRIEQVTRGTFRVKPVAFSITASHGGRRLAGFFVGRIGEPAKGEVLPSNASGAAPIGDGF